MVWFVKREMVELREAKNAGSAGRGKLSY